jgi:hypothetical protein
MSIRVTSLSLSHLLDQVSLGMTSDPFAHVRRAVAPLEALSCPWFVAGGWAIDLFLGRVTRPHGDVDIALYRHDQGTLRDFLSQIHWNVEQVVAGEARAWPAGRWLALPVHEVHATTSGGDATLEFLMNEGDALEWRFRKAPTVTRLRAAVERRSPGGLPYLAPELVLLYKALTPARRPTDDADFAAALPALTPEPRYWLASTLGSLAPQHPWFGPLLQSSEL